MADGVLPHAYCLKRGHGPVVGTSSLPLQLVNLDGSVGASVSELGSDGNVPHVLDGDRRSATRKAIQDVPDGPGTLVAVTDLVRLPARTRGHRTT
jgi:hypothetical protein